MSLTNNAAWLRQAGDRLRARGFTVLYEPGWETRSNGTLAPDHEAIIVHHTGATTTSTAYLRDGEKGRTMTPPYAQIHIRRDATIVIIAAGGASHAGYVHQPCWDRIIGQTAPLDRDILPGSDSTTFSANRPGLGVEVNGAGGPDDWTPQQRAAVVAFCSEYHQVRGWTGIPKVGGHKELTKRKPGDPVANMGTLRTNIMTDIQEDDMPLSDQDLDRIYQRVWFGGSGLPLIGQRLEGGGAWPETILGALTDRIVRQQVAPLRGELAGLSTAVGQLATSQGLDPAAIRDAVRQAVSEAVASIETTVTVRPEGA